MSEDRFEKINVGEEAEIFHTITEQDVSSFVKLTGDTNPLHVDDGFASTTSFKKRVVHGMLTASFISTIIGTQLPGKGSLWYEQRIRFLEPVRIGDKIRVWARVKQKSSAQRIVVLETIVFAQSGRRIIEGEAKVRVVKTEKRLSAMSRPEKGAIIISGASRGIGAAIAKEMAGDGYPVIVNYFHSEAQAEEVVQEIKEKDGQAISFRADVTDCRTVKEMVDLALTEFEVISGIVNNASSSIDTKNFIDLSWDEIQKHIDTQIKGAFHLCQAVLPHMIDQKSGTIVNIGSIFADNVPPIQWMPYNMAKSALIAFTKTLAAEYGPKSIRVNCVSPGMTETDWVASVPEKVKMVTIMQTPLRRLAVPKDIASTVAFLFNKQAAFITGQNIRVCGGIVMA